MMSKKLDILSLIACVAAVVAVIMWFVSFSTYPAAAVNSVAGTIFGICSVVLMAITALGLPQGKLRGLMILAAGILLVLFFYQFAMGRVSITADAYFIPVNHPVEEDTAMTQTIVGIAAALVSFLIITIDAFVAKD